MKLKRITAFIGAFAVSLSVTANLIAVQAAETALSYNLTGGAGIADGTITLNVEDSTDITSVKLWWGSSESEKLAQYDAIKNYTTAETLKSKETALVFADNALSYEISGSRLVPDGATHIIAEITKNDASTQAVAAPIPAENKFVDEGYLYSMLVLSDVHVAVDSVFSNSRQNVAFANLKSFLENADKKPEAMIINGDMADTSKDYEYATLEEIIAKNIDIPVYYNTGNHDTSNYGYENCVAAMDYRFEQLKKQGYEVTRDDKWSYDVWVKGQHHIFLAYPYGDSWGISDKQKKWLEESIEEGEQSGAPTFLYIHCPLYETVAKTYGSFTSGSINSEVLDNIIARHPNLVVFTSHLHLDLNTDLTTAVVNNGAASYVDTSAVAYNQPFESSETKSSGGHGRLVQIYEDKVVIRAMDLVNQLYVPRAEYVIPFSGTKMSAKASIAATDLNAGSTVQALLDGTAVDTEKYTVEWYVNGTKQEEASNTFTIAAADENVSVKIIDKNAQNSYAWANTNIRTEYVPETSDGEDEEQPQEDQITINGTDVEYKGNIVYVTGSFSAAAAGKNAILLLVPQDTYTQLDTAAYLNECTVASDGSYTFKFKTSDVDLSGNYAMIVKLEGADVVASNVIEKLDNEGLAEITPSIDETGIVSLKIKNYYLDSMDKVKLIAAEYAQDGRLVKAIVTDYNLAFGQNGEVQDAAFAEALSSANKIKVFMWKDMSSLTPLADSEEIQVVAAQ